MGQCNKKRKDKKNSNYSLEKKVLALSVLRRSIKLSRGKLYEVNSIQKFFFCWCNLKDV